jgi:prohibitin 2
MGILFFLLFLGSLGFAGYSIVSRDQQYDKLNFNFHKGYTGFGLAALFLFLMLSFTSVASGTRSVVTRFGKVNRTLEPGAHLLIPFAEFTHDISVQTQTVKPSEDAASLDLQIVHAEVTLAYHYDPQYVDFAYSQLGGDGRDSVINPAILEAIKSRTAQYPASDLVAKRPLVRDGIDEFVKTRLAPYHIVVETVSITDFHFSKEYEDSIENKVVAIQKAEQAQNDLARIKIEADQKVAAAQGEASALKAQKEQITPELLQLRTIEMLDKKWDGHLPENYYGGVSPLPMMDVLKSGKR